MSFVVLLGGARCGKSRLAVDLAVASAGPVTFLATGAARDDEMEARIAAHQAERPGHWNVVEEPYAITRAIAAVPGEDVLLVDCLSLWVANALETVIAPTPRSKRSQRRQRAQPQRGRP